MFLVCRESADALWSIRHVSSQSEGNYICNATNSAGTSIATTYLDVKGTSLNFSIFYVKNTYKQLWSFPCIDICAFYVILMCVFLS